MKAVFPALSTKTSESFFDKMFSRGCGREVQLPVLNPQRIGLLCFRARTRWGNTPNDNPLSVGQTTVQARHITELRAAINALRSHMNLSAYSWQYSATTNDYISANTILEMRTALDQALGAPSGGYSAGLSQGQPVKAIHIQELRDRVLAAWQSGSGLDK